MAIAKDLDTMQPTCPSLLGYIQNLSKKILGKSNIFVGHVWTKIRRDAQYQWKEIQD